MTAFIVIPVGEQLISDIEVCRISGVYRGAAIKTQDGTSGVLVWNSEKPHLIIFQLKVLANRGFEAFTAHNFHEVAHLVEKFT